jgi:hypothetical protein
VLVCKSAAYNKAARALKAPKAADYFRPRLSIAFFALGFKKKGKYSSFRLQFRPIEPIATRKKLLQAKTIAAGSYPVVTLATVSGLQPTPGACSPRRRSVRQT